ncbi:MAG: nucleotidyl transferase AbiEii/AbiGii toxin family protein [Gemmatimonadetes bacterium]|nr:nucleotidyl transferase AbiEii/AbiGii toxin family protein [Gemmatimonadota bacterium]
MTQLHARLIGVVADAEREYGHLDLRLEGGTALAAYYLEHRQSQDLDFFGGPGMDARDFGALVKDRIRAAGLHITREGPASRGFTEFLVSDRPAPEEGESARIELGRASPFQLEPPNPTREGVPVASYRDVCAGKLHALCDRYEPRDYIDLHCFLGRWGPGEPPPTEAERRRRFVAHAADLEACDPGLNPPLLGQALQRGLGRPILSAFPLRVLVPLTEQEIQETIRLGLEECAWLTRQAAGWGERPE